MLSLAYFSQKQEHFGLVKLLEQNFRTVLSHQKFSQGDNPSMLNRWHTKVRQRKGAFSSCFASQVHRPVPEDWLDSELIREMVEEELIQK